MKNKFPVGVKHFRLKIFTSFFDNRNHFAYKSILLLNIKKDYLGLGSIPLYFYRKIYCQLNVDLFRSAGFLIE
jgi:hypothetical protein